MLPPWWMLPLVLACLALPSRTSATALILLADWCIGTIVANLNGSTDAWAWNATIDTFASWALIGVCLLRQDRLAALVALTCVLDVVTHCAYGIHMVVHGYQWSADNSYYWTTFAIAWAQAALLVIWGGFNGRGKLSRSGDVFGHQRMGIANRAKLVLARCRNR